MRVGIIGAGKLGTALARRAFAAGHDVLIAGRPGAAHTDLVIEVTVPGAVARAVAEWGTVDIAILAVPFSIALDIDLLLPAGTIVIDPTNHWEPVDGPRPDLGGLSTSEAIATNHPTLIWVKTLNQYGYHDLDSDDLSALDRSGMGIATDSEAGARTATELLISLGLDPVTVGPLAAGAALEPGHNDFGRALVAQMSSTGRLP